MNRRDLIKTGIASLALPLIPRVIYAENVSYNSIKASALTEGDAIGIIAPGTAVPDPDDLLKAKQAAEYFGLKPKISERVAEGTGYKSRSVDERIDDLHGMFANNDIKAIICIRGGYGSGQLLDKIDYGLIKDNPKIFLGYSDITALHIAIHQNTGLTTFHGPVMLSGFNNYTVEYFKKALFNSVAIGEIKNPASLSGIRPAFPVRTISGGKATGKLTGGNLSLICSLMGTPFEIDTKDKILFIEDVGEDPYRIDRMLTQLNLAGKLKESAGIVFGKCAGCDKDGQSVWDWSLGEVLDYQIGGLGIPAFYGLMIGHTAEQVTLPYGVESRINADTGLLNITEAGVI